jgi:hypothetical protein
MAKGNRHDDIVMRWRTNFTNWTFQTEGVKIKLIKKSTPSAESPKVILLYSSYGLWVFHTSSNNISYISYPSVFFFSGVDNTTESRKKHQYSESHWKMYEKEHFALTNVYIISSTPRHEQEWVCDYCLTPNEQFYRTRTGNILTRWSR